MLKELGKASQLTKKSYTEETEMSIFYEKVGDYLAKRGIGIKEAIMKYLSRTG
jgi:Rod binding domain-containing protein